jgi:3-dehydro-L-gulonate-6-phosphate decarboxylase
MATRRLQLALDLLDLDKARKVAASAASNVDVIEVGTLLCLSEGMHAVRALRRDHPDKIIVADVRIVRAGKNIAQMAFDAGADWVSTVAEAPLETIEAALDVAKRFEGELQVELNEGWTRQQAETWFAMGIRHVIAHCTAEVESIGSGWSLRTVETLKTLAGMGFTVTAAGGIDAKTLPSLARTPAQVFVVGRSIAAAADPRAAAAEMKSLIA